jgi:MinD-like ATPase involved in chromosome partitioning or flagellar assembly
VDRLHAAAQKIGGGLDPARPATRAFGRVWAVASGSGGVGRSTFVAALGSRLLERGHSVCLVDADASGPSLAALLDVEGGAVETPWKGGALSVRRSSVHARLTVVSGGPPTGSDPSRSAGKRLQKSIEGLEADSVVVDLPAGTSEVAMDLWLAADNPVLVTVPERMPLEATARLLARVFARRVEPWLARRFGASVARDCLAEGWDRCAGRPGTWMRSVAQVAGVDADELAQCGSNKPIHLVLNRARRGDDVDVGHALVTAAGHGLGIDLKFRAVLPEDDESWIRARRNQGGAPGQPGDLLSDEVDDFLRRMELGQDVAQPGDWKASLKEAAQHAVGG